MGCASSTRRSVRVEQESWAGVAPNQPRAERQAPSAAAEAAAAAAAAARAPENPLSPAVAAAASASAPVAMQANHSVGSAAEPMATPECRPAAAGRVVAEASPAAAQQGQEAERTPADARKQQRDPSSPIQLPVDVATKSLTVGLLASPSSSPAHMPAAAAQKVVHDTAESRPTLTGLSAAARPDAPCGQPDSPTESTKATSEHSSFAASRVDESSSAAKSTPTAASPIADQSGASSASSDVLDNSVCIALDGETFTPADTDAAAVEAALLNHQRHFTRRDTFDPYSDDAALRYVMLPSSIPESIDQFAPD